jgi:hypothetical protein
MSEDEDFDFEFELYQDEYIFVITRKLNGISEYTIVAFDNSEGEFDASSAERELFYSLSGGWETLGHVDNILDGEDFIDRCIDIDEMIEFTD